MKLLRLFFSAVVAVVGGILLYLILGILILLGDGKPSGSGGGF